MKKLLTTLITGACIVLLMVGAFYLDKASGEHVRVIHTGSDHNHTDILDHCPVCEKQNAQHEIDSLKNVIKTLASK